MRNMSYFHEWIVVTGIVSCYDKFMMKDILKETMLKDTFVVVKTH